MGAIAATVYNIFFGSKAQAVQGTKSCWLACLACLYYMYTECAECTMHFQQMAMMIAIQYWRVVTRQSERKLDNAFFGLVSF